MEKKIKILQIIPNLNRTNGVNAYICNYFFNMDNSNVEWYFAILNNESYERYDEIIEHGGHIIEIYRDKNPFKYAKKVKKLFNDYKFDIVHCNVANIGLFFLYYAKKANVKTRILHSHGTVSGEILSHRIRNDLIIPFSRYYSNVYFACSEAAGKAMFKNKPFYVVNNGIHYEKFLFNDIKRKEIREQLGLDDKIIIGNVGRLSYQKNQEFLIKSFAQSYKHNKQLVLLLFGDGNLKEKYLDLISDLGLENNIILMGSINNINDYYNALDLFVLPSNFEGLPVVGIEAQVNGLKCLFSNKITKETDISGLSKFLPINSNEALKLWSGEMVSTTFRINNIIANNDYEIKDCSKKLKEKYFELIKRD